jgi:hypothetical protein
MPQGPYKLRFDLEALRPIVEHALTSKEHEPTLDMRADPTYWKTGAAPDAYGCAALKDMELGKVPGHLKLAKDRGVYMLSSGLPKQEYPEGKTKVRVAYARGMGVADGYDAWSRVGGDDFVERIDLDFVARAIAKGDKQLTIELTAHSLRIAFERDLERERPPINIREIQAVERLVGASAKRDWAKPGQTYDGPIVGYDTHVTLQKVGRRVVLHEKALLPDPRPERGDKVRIGYPADDNAVATVGPVARKTHSEGLSP